MENPYFRNPYFQVCPECEGHRQSRVLAGSVQVTQVLEQCDKCGNEGYILNENGKHIAQVIEYLRRNGMRQ